VNDNEERKDGQAGRVYGCHIICTSGGIQSGLTLRSMSVMFPVCKAPGPHSSILEEFLHSIILRPKKPIGSWNLVNPLLSMNEA